MPKAKSRKSPQRSARGGAAAVVDSEPGVVMQLLTRSPKDTLAAGVAAAAVVAIITNAVWLQAGRHPAPMFGNASTVPLNPPPSRASVMAPQSPLPKPRPADGGSLGAHDLNIVDPSLLDSRPVEKRPLDKRSSVDQIDAVAMAGSQPSTARGVARPPAIIQASAQSSDPLGDLIVASRRTTLVQRALTEFGYGQLVADGMMGPGTQAAIQRFEKDRKLPVTGQISDRLVRELSAMTGRAID